MKRDLLFVSVNIACRVIAGADRQVNKSLKTSI